MKIIRIDDYPTGVRPITQLNEIHKFIGIFEDLKINYHLGIVPLLLNNTMINFLKKLSYCIPTLHGFDHCFFQKSLICERNADLKNKYSISGNFNEFGESSYDEIFQKILWGKNILQSVFKDKIIDTYIPPCNIINKNTDKALHENSFRRCFSDGPIPEKKHLQYIKSDFYGKILESNNEDLSKDVITLHATWEADDIENGLYNEIKNKLKCLT